LRTRALFRRDRPASRGQALVETALLLPILLILLLGAIDFGRLFFGWVNLHQAVRIGANFAATNPDMATERDRYVDLITGDLEGLNCDADTDNDGDIDGDDLPDPTYTTPDGTPVTVPTLGDYATVTLDCDFSPITPLGDVFFGDPIAMSATSTFPIREGCITCPEVEPEPPPPTPLQCRLVPDMDGMSVAGARLAWASAGFDPDKFTPAIGQDTSTVASAVVTEDDPLSTCEFPTFAIFSSSVLIAVETEDTGTGCAVVPNLIGITLSDGVDTWTGATFTGPLTVGGADPATADPNGVITSQVTTPASEPGVSCIDPAASIDVQVGAAWPAPPPAPCRVPNMINLFRDEGQAAWGDANFEVGNFSPPSGRFKIRAQSLVGGTYVPCEASIVVADKAN
jgi:hypothetical protein